MLYEHSGCKTSRLYWVCRKLLLLASCDLGHLMELVSVERIWDSCRPLLKGSHSAAMRRREQQIDRRIVVF